MMSLSLPIAASRPVAAAAALVASAALTNAANLIWDGSTDNNWNDGSNWDLGSVPNLDGTDVATIANGDTVNYPANVLGDINIRPGSELTISGGSTLQQTQTNWTQINGGAMTVDGGLFERTAGGNLVLGFQANTTSTLAVTNGGMVEIVGELWFGHNLNTGNQVVTSTLNGGNITTGGVVGIWFWDTDSPGNSFTLDFIPGAVSTISVADRIGRRNSAGSDNTVAWETLWNEGILTVNGSSAGTFSDFFTTSGTSAADATPYTLTFTGVPEPSRGLLLLLGGLLALARRHRS